MKFFIKTFGCKVNLCDSEKIRLELLKLGHEIAEDYINCDVLIVNSCTVTAESDRKVRQFINKIKKINPHAKIVLAGCLIRAFPGVRQKLNVDYVYDIYKKDEISKIIEKISENSENLNNFSENFDDRNTFPTPKHDRTRAFIKIEDGCNNFCSYCIIPYARGRVRSKSIDCILKEAEIFAENGFKEIVLVGINLSVYGTDINSSLCEIVERIAKISKVKRIRLGSLEANFLTEKNIIRLSKIEKFCPQFHVSLQSGSNKILKLMNRKYTREKYIEICKNIKKICQNSTITTDIIVGFPGETEEDFADSLDLISKVGFLKVHIFPYSMRSGTKAATFENQIKKSTKHERTKKMFEVAEKVSKKVRSEQMQKTLEVLYETRDDKRNYFGYSKNYLRVTCNSDKDIRGKILPTMITEVTEIENIGKITT